VATVTDTRVSPTRADRAACYGALDVTAAEAELLRAALHGDWVDLLIALWPSWGFCPRHAIGFATVELELRDRLFSTAINYQHFVEAAAEIAGARFCSWRDIRGDGIVCRVHLLAGAEQDELGPALGALCERLRRFIDSMCAQKTETDLLDRVSWLETIGWFGGWEHPRLLMEEVRTGER
jgi:hypothetical protein